MRAVVLVLALMAACKPIDDKEDPDTAEESDPIDDSDPVVETDETDPVVETDETDPVVETDETDPVVETDETDPTIETDETDLPIDTVDSDPDTDVPTDTVVIDTRLAETGVDDTFVPPDTDPPSGETDESGRPDDSGETGETGFTFIDDTFSGDTVDTDTPAETGGVPTGPWRASLVVDGDLSDCPLGARFQTSSGAGPWACITWDETDLYVGFHHPDVATGGPAHYLWLYAGGRLTPGAALGVTYNTQTPVLSPIWQTHVRWQATHTFNSKLSYSGGAWGGEVVDYLWTSGAIAENAALQEVELRIPLADLTDTSVLPLVLGWIFEGTGAERTYAGVPAVSFSDGYDPDLRAWYAFSLTGTTAPNAYLPVIMP
jgi:hypothetical protein